MMLVGLPQCINSPHIVVIVWTSFPVCHTKTFEHRFACFAVSNCIIDFHVVSCPYLTISMHLTDNTIRIRCAIFDYASSPKLIMTVPAENPVVAFKFGSNTFSRIRSDNETCTKEGDEVTLSISNDILIKRWCCCYGCFKKHITPLKIIPMTSPFFWVSSGDFVVTPTVLHSLPSPPVW